MGCVSKYSSISPICKSKQKITSIPETIVLLEIRENCDSDKSDYAVQNNVELVKSNRLNLMNP